jgi:hypothetical protein
VKTKPGVSRGLILLLLLIIIIITTTALFAKVYRNILHTMMNISEQSSIVHSGTQENYKRKRFESLLPSRKIIRIISKVPSTFDANRKPHEALLSMLSSQGFKARTFAHDSLPHFFEEITEKELQAYDADALTAVRNADMETLHKFHQEGRPLKCSNQFGESLLHLACRKGLVSVVKFLVCDVGVPLNVRDDMGRSPLHDAFWTPEPNFELVDFILKMCPNLVVISDKRGHPPLEYTRRDDWGKWNEFLRSRAETMRPNISGLSKEQQ